MTDMGLAKLKMGGSSIINVIGSDNRGTPYYSAPETFYGQVGKASDVSTVLLELYTGKHAWGEV